MPIVTQLTEESAVNAVILLIVWCAAIRGLGYAFFQSAATAAVLKRWRYNEERQREGLEYELRHGHSREPEEAEEVNEADKDCSAEACQKAKTRPKYRSFSVSELRTRVDELNEIRGKLQFKRFVQAFLGCPVCQYFWVALALGLSYGHGKSAILDAFAYSGLTVLLFHIVLGSRGDRT